MIKVDARGLSCPQPVLATKNAIIDHPKSIEVLVDNETAKGNVKRFLTHSGYDVTFDSQDENIIVKGQK